MDIQMSELRLVESELGIPVDVLIGAIEDALLHAYQRVPGAIKGARVEMDHATGKTKVRTAMLSASLTTPPVISGVSPRLPPSLLLPSVCAMQSPTAYSALSRANKARLFPVLSSKIPILIRVIC